MVKAQSVVEGRVKNNDTNIPIANVSIILRTEKGGNVVQFVQTSINGDFKMIIKEDLESFNLSASTLGYATYEINLKKGNHSLEFSLIPQDIAIEEVVVYAKRIYQHHDTINYTVSSFAESQDRTIGDVLKKLPGIEVQNGGRILYNGKAINKFYIEGLDLLDGKYGLITNNISPNDIGTVQVIENHQPIKVTDNINFSDQAAINLTLKEGSKSKWISQLGIGGGIPSLWDGDFFTMRMAKRNQNLNLYKTNNIGQNISNETESKTVDQMVQDMENNVVQNSQIELQMPIPPSLEEQRTLFNRSHIVSINNLWNLKQDYLLKAGISYSNDKNKGEQALTTTYFQPNNDSLVFEEQTNVNYDINKLSSNLTLTTNKENFYLNNTLKVKGSWTNDKMAISGTNDNMQIADIQNFIIQNDFNLYKNIDNKILKLSSFTHYSFLPQNLAVRTTSEEGYQTAELTQFLSNISASYSKSIKKWTVETKFGLRIKNQILESHLTSHHDSIGTQINDIRLRDIEGYLTPMLSYNNNWLRLSAEIDVSYRNNIISNRVSNKDEGNNLLSFASLINSRIVFNPFWSLNLNFSTQEHKSGNIDDLNTAFILRNYRNLQLGTSELPLFNQYSYGVGITYRNPVKSFFTNINAIYSPTVSHYLHAQNFIDFYLFETLVEQKNNREFIMLTAQVSKGIDALRATTSISVIYNRIKMELLQNKILTPFYTESLRIKPRFFTRIFHWSNFEYVAEIIINNLTINDSNRGSLPIGRINQIGKLILTPSKNIDFRVSVEHLYNKTNSKKTHLALGDIGITYRIKQNVELNLDITNIFDKKEYEYNVYNNLSTLIGKYTIRPRNILLNIQIRL